MRVGDQHCYPTIFAPENTPGKKRATGHQIAPLLTDRSKTHHRNVLPIQRTEETFGQRSGRGQRPQPSKPRFFGARNKNPMDRDSLKQMI
jgi:hypothetical protein